MKYRLGQVIKKFTTKKGKPAIIRVVKSTDLDPMLNYANSLVEEDTFIMLSEKLTRKQETEYLRDSIKKVKAGNKIHLVIEVENKFAGSAEVRIFSKRKAHVGEIGISLHQNYRDSGIGQAAFQVLIDQARKLGLKLLTLNCFENNSRAIHVYQKFGFQKAGKVPGMYSYKNKYIGEIKMYKQLF